SCRRSSPCRLPERLSEKLRRRSETLLHGVPFVVVPFFVPGPALPALRKARARTRTVSHWVSFEKRPLLFRLLCGELGGWGLQSYQRRLRLSSGSDVRNTADHFHARKLEPEPFTRRRDGSN